MLALWFSKLSTVHAVKQTLTNSFSVVALRLRYRQDVWRLNTETYRYLTLN